MTLVVEDGTGLSAANAYVSVAFVDSYSSDRGLTTWTGTTAEKEQKIIQATQYVDVRFGPRFKGSRFTSTQSLEFPRDKAGDLPVLLKNAVAEYAIRASTSLMPDPAAGTAGLTLVEESKELGPLKTSKKYEITGGVSGGRVRVIPFADSMIRQLLRTSGVAIRG